MFTWCVCWEGVCINECASPCATEGQRAATFSHWDLEISS